MAAKILPSREYLRECLDYDPATGVLTWRIRPVSHFPNIRAAARWNGRYSTKEAGYQAPSSRYLRVSIGKSLFKAHRIIWKMLTDADPSGIDHRNGDGSDNRFDNLRQASLSQNGKNQAGWTGRSLPKGVSVRRSGFRARICVNGTQILIGHYATAEEAHLAYRKAAAKYHGDFANFGRGDQ